MVAIAQLLGATLFVGWSDDVVIELELPSEEAKPVALILLLAGPKPVALTMLPDSA
jgi:hypothetical protein